MARGRDNRLGSRRGTAPFRRGEKSSELRVGTGTDGNPAIFANVGGKVYSTPLSLVNLGQEQREMNLDNLNIGNNVSFSNNGIKLDAPLKFVPSSDTDISPPAGETWVHVYRPVPIEVTIEADYDTFTATGFSLHSTNSSYELGSNDSLIGGIVTNKNVTHGSKNVSAPITDNTNKALVHTEASRIGWADGHVAYIQGPVKYYIVFNDGYNNYYYSLNLTSTVETVNASDNTVNGVSRTYLQVSSDAPSYEDTAGEAGVTGGAAKKPNVVL